MPRDGTETYILPFPDVVADTTIESPVYNGFTNDVAQDLNTPRPIIYGGTGATSAAGALAALGGETASQVVTNYDSYVFKAGSFYSAAGATAAPTANAFSGICYLSDANNIVTEARDSTTGLLHIRRKVTGVWSAWTLDTAIVDAAINTKAPIASPTFTGNPQAPTPTAGDNDTSVATTAFVVTAVAGTIRTVKIQKFIASGTYTPSVGMAFCIIECVGSGGGGGGVTGAINYALGASGGGAGSYSRTIASAATIGASQAVTVGTPGNGGGTGSNGAPGNSVTVGAVCTANGGSGGTVSTTGSTSSAGAGGTVGVGDLTFPGGSGGGGMYVTATGISASAYSGHGGHAYFGAGGVAVSAATAITNGAAGTGFGAGGGGGAVANVASGALGGQGAKGIAVITEFCTQ